MNLDQTQQDMVRDIARTGMRASVLLQGVMLQKVDEETLRWGLGELNLDDHMSRYLPYLVSHSEYVHLLNILHLLFSLEGQLDFQIREYGLDSLKDDLQEINFSLQRIGEQFDFAELAQAV